MSETTQPEPQVEQQQANLGAVIERLDRLEGVLRDLLELMRAGQRGAVQPVVAVSSQPTHIAGPAPISVASPAYQAVPAAIPVAPPNYQAVAGIPVAPQAGPPVIPVAPPIREQSWSQPQAVGARSENEVHFFQREFDSGLTPDATIHQVLTRLFEAALMPNQDEAFGIMAALTHHTQMQGPRAFEHFKGFAWSKLRRNARSYLQTEDPGSFVVSYTEPRQIPADARAVRIFVHAQQRMPVPVSFERDPTQGYAWRITMMSL